MLLLGVLILSGMTGFQLWSPAFNPGGEIPQKYSCDGLNASPPLGWSSPPPQTESMVLIMDDPDAPKGTFTHWLYYDLDPSVGRLEETVAKDVKLPDDSRQGINDAGSPGYTGPCPPSGTHHYFFRLYALDNAPSIPPGTNREMVERALRGHVLAQTELMGRYRR